MAPLQANEVNILRRKCQQFEVPQPQGGAVGEACSVEGQARTRPRMVFPQLKQHEFREKFRQEAPFTFRDPDPYKSLNKVFLLKDEGQRPGTLLLSCLLSSCHS